MGDTLAHGMERQATILIVEDERVVAADLAALLRLLGYAVSGIAASQEQALAMASAVRPDLVLMDVRIRGAGDGIATAALLREQFGIPVVYLSASADDATLQRARQTRPYGFLVKPFRERELKSALEIALHHHELESRLEAVLANIEDGVALVDAERRLILTNPAYRAMFGLTTAQVNELSSEKAMAQLAGCMRDPDEAQRRLEALTLAPDPSTVHFELARPRRIVRRTVKPVRVGYRDGFMVIWRDETAELDLATERARLARIDVLTGLGNRRTAEEVITRELARTRRVGMPLSLAIFDVDHFKQVNDVHGHAAGDAVLRTVGSALCQEARGSDTIVRWGGDEMLAVLPVGLDGAVVFCERVRVAVEALATPAGPITVSAGVVQIADDEDVATAFDRGDRQLYEAKRAGRNRVSAARAS